MRRQRRGRICRPAVATVRIGPVIVDQVDQRPAMLRVRRHGGGQRTQGEQATDAPVFMGRFFNMQAFGRKVASTRTTAEHIARSW
ncbi:hypothetical protein CR103_04400 [Massilia psychrophila]|uniref:Uncharacterized protein n=1 Tax=Massilia psychrophila TaxID=1603353 RepID=A0A2G8T4T7_9BURK|nr:hypothetical protein CR103_04400 [Massilia psychrophila]GGE68733.1 hypothetical protein GCM10008020_11410 [Massilia psychrophila]